jgi:hypothetical protein
MKSQKDIAKSQKIGLAGFAGLLLCAVLATAAQVEATQETKERKLEALSVDGQTFENVTVYQQTPTDVMFGHNRGVTGLKVQYLDNPTLRRLGYEIQAPPPTTTTLASERLGSLPLLVPPGHFRSSLMVLSAAILLLLFGMFLYTVYLLRLICIKSGTKPGFAIWVPFLQAFPLLRAARMSWAWPLAITSLSVLLVYAAFRVPEHTVVFGTILAAAIAGLAVVWSVRICHACGKSSLLAVLLLTPGLNCLALVYLAASK